MDWIKEVVVMMLVDGVTIISFLALFAGIILWRGLGSFLGRIDGRMSVDLGCGSTSVL